MFDFHDLLKLQNLLSFFCSKSADEYPFLNSISVVRACASHSNALGEIHFHHPLVSS